MGQVETDETENWNEKLKAGTEKQKAETEKLKTGNGRQTACTNIRACSNDNVPVSTVHALVILCTFGCPAVGFLAYLKPVHLSGVPDTMMVVTYNVSCLLQK